MIDFLNLVRWKNLLLIALVQSLIKYALFPSFEATITLSDFQFTLLLLATLFIAAAGNIINDIYDVETDLVNKPNKIIVGKHISEKAAFNLFIIFNIFLRRLKKIFNLFMIIFELVFIYFIKFNKK